VGWPICVQKLASIEAAGTENWTERGAMCRRKQKEKERERKRLLFVRVNEHHTSDSCDCLQEYISNM